MTPRYQNVPIKAKLEYQTIPVRTCGNCKNYHPVREDYGECHAHPPVLIVDYSTARGKWPQVEPTEWCGEFRGKEC